MKEEIVKDITLWNSKFLHEFPDLNIITRDYYRSNGKYKDTQINKYFGSFKNAVKEIFNKDELDSISYKKRIHVLEEQNKAYEKENQKLIKSEVVEDTLIQEFQKRLSSGILIENIKEIKIPKGKKEVKKKEAILTISDIHLGELINAIEINGINEYNSDIMKERLDRIFYYFIYYCKKYEIKTVNILLLGDLLSGGHVPELMKYNEFSDVEALFILQEYFCNKLVEIQDNFSEIKVEILAGNHSRIPEGKPEYKKAAIVNYEYILAKQLKIFFDLIQKDNKEKKIKINVNESLFKVIDIADRKFLITHGHILSNGSNSFAGIPYYGLAMSASKIEGAFKQFESLNFSDILIGHLHCLSKVKTPFGNLYINGSIIGVNEFALFKMKVTSTPEQLMLIVEDGFVNSEITLRA